MIRRVAACCGTAFVLGLVLPAAPASAGGCGSVTQGGGTTVEMVNACFTPSIVRVRPGRTVTFVNRDSFAHSLFGAGLRWGKDEIGAGGAVAETFERPGVYPFSCYYHPGMTGAVVVGDGSGPGPATRTGVTVEPLLGSSPAPAGREEPAPGANASGIGWLAGGAIGTVLGAGLVISARRIRGVPPTG